LAVTTLLNASVERRAGSLNRQRARIAARNTPKGTMMNPPITYGEIQAFWLKRVADTEWTPEERAAREALIPAMERAREEKLRTIAAAEKREAAKRARAEVAAKRLALARRRKTKTGKIREKQDFDIAARMEAEWMAESMAVQRLLRECEAHESSLLGGHWPLPLPNYTPFSEMAFYSGICITGKERISMAGIRTVDRRGVGR
jgi:hypothetical protein